MGAELARLCPRKAAFVLAPGVLAGLLDAVEALGPVPLPRSGGAMRHVLVAFVVAAIVWVLLSAADAAAARRAPRAVRDPGRGAPSWRSCIGLAALSALGWLVMWAVIGPMDSMNDTYWIIRSPFGMARQHPVVYNMVVSGIAHAGLLLTGRMLAGVIAAVALQVVLFAVALAATLRVLGRMGAPAWMRIALAVALGALPITADTAIALVKDSAFTAFVLALVPVLLTIARTRGSALRRRPFLLAAVGACLGFALTRNNALAIVVLVAAMIVALSSRARRRALASAAAIVVIALVPQQIVAVASGPQKAAESLGIPLQMIGSTLVHAPGCIAPDDARELGRIMPLDAWRERFHAQSVDAVKYAPEFDGDELQASRGRFLAVFVRTLAHCPGPMLLGYRDHTAQLWRWDAAPLGQTSQSYFLEPVSNHPSDRAEIQRELARQGIVKHPLVGGATGARIGAAYQAVLERTPGTGTWMWALGLVAWAFVYRRRVDGLVVVAPALLLWGTLMAAAPVAAPFRYVAFLPWVLGAALVVLLGTREQTTVRRRRLVSPR